MKRNFFTIFLILCCFMISYSCKNNSCNNNTDIDITGKAVIIISANIEWNAFCKITNPTQDELKTSPYGNWLLSKIGDKEVIFFHGGWGKIDAAGSAQYVIDKFKPSSIINIGTAGGFPEKTQKGNIIIASKTITYDIYEKMGDSQEAIDYYTTEITYPFPNETNTIKIAPIVSGDQDLFPEKIPFLEEKYVAFCGDWESSAIAHVAKKNNVPCCIMRGISDVVYPEGSETYGSLETFEKSTQDIMQLLLKQLEKIEIL